MWNFGFFLSEVEVDFYVVFRSFFKVKDSLISVDADICFELINPNQLQKHLCFDAVLLGATYEQRNGPITEGNYPFTQENRALIQIFISFC